MFADEWPLKFQNSYTTAYFYSIVLKIGTKNPEKILGGHLDFLIGTKKNIVFVEVHPCDVCFKLVY